VNTLVHMGLTLWKEGGEDFLFITDHDRHEVYKTTIDGKPVMTLKYPKETGAYASADEYKPTETAVGPNGDIYVADGYGKSFIIQYNSKGEYIRHFGGKGEAMKISNKRMACVLITGTRKIPAYW
jgi:peptidylamidoglycolate lyase